MRNQHGNGTLSGFMSKWSQKVLGKEQRKQLSLRKQELTTLDSRMRETMISIKVAQSDVQDRDIEDNMRITGFQMPSDRSSPLKVPLHIQVNSAEGAASLKESSRRRRNFSTLQKNTSRREQKKFMSLTPDAPKSSQKICFPTLLHKAKRHKIPSNASKNSVLSYRPLSPPQKQPQVVTYQQIKTQRIKADSLRHMTVLGRVMQQNYKKQMHKIQTRRKLFNKTKTTQ